MPTLIFRCSVTGHNVQGWIAEDVSADPAEQIFISLRCTACSQTHAVNPAAAEVLGPRRPKN
jgi:hypothetical protein